MKHPASEKVLESRIEARCRASGLKLTAYQRLIVHVISEARDHPDFAELYRRIAERDAHLSRPTLQRTLRLFTQEGIIERQKFRDRRYRYEPISDIHHDHLIDVTTGQVCDFANAELELLQKDIALKLGFELTGHRLELYVKPLPRVARRDRRPSKT
jgi:Fur family ferric uptake transcriptional regulator